MQGLANSNVDVVVCGLNVDNHANHDVDLVATDLFDAISNVIGCDGHGGHLF